MSNVSASSVMAGVTAGYLLGRTKKLKLALIVGSAIANRKLVSGQVDKLTDAAGVGPLGEQLVGVGRKAALGAVSSRIDSLSDRIAERTNRLNGFEDEPEGESEDEPQDEYEDEPADDEEQPEDEYDEEPAEDEEPVDEYDEEPAEDEEYEDEYEEAAR